MAGILAPLASTQKPIQIVDPRYLSFGDWANNSFFGTGTAELDVPPATDEVNWKWWAVQLKKYYEATDRTVPDPDMFTDWRDWAMRVYGEFM